jgi:hypothetical protein
VNGAILRPSWRSRIPARREGVLEANGVFSRLIGKALGFGNSPAAAGRGRATQDFCRKNNAPRRKPIVVAASSHHAICVICGLLI